MSGGKRSSVSPARQSNDSCGASGAAELLEVVKLQTAAIDRMCEAVADLVDIMHEYVELTRADDKPDDESDKGTMD